MAQTLKTFFSPTLVRRLAADLVRAEPAFPERAFVRRALAGLDSLELLDRARHIARALAEHLPQDYRRALDVLLRSLGPELSGDELIGVGQGNISSGAFSHPVALAYRVEGGQITGRVKDAAIAGNAFDLLKRIKAIGRDGKWCGATRYVPPMVFEDVNVAGR